MSTERSLAAGPTLGERASLLLLSLTSNVLALALPLALLQVYDRIVPNQAQGTAAVLFSAVLVALLADGFLRYVRFRTLAHIGARFEFASTERLVERLFDAKLAELRDVGAGRLRSAITALSQSRELYTGQGLLPFFDAPFGALFLLLVWYLGGSLVLVPLAILLLLGVAALWSGKRHRRSLTDLAAAEQQRTGLIGEAFAGLESHKTLGLAGPLFQRFVDTEGRRAEATQRSERLSGLFTDLSQIGSQAATLAIALFGSLIVLGGDMTTGGLAACSILGGRGIGALLGMLGALSRRQAAHAAEEQVARLLSLTPRDEAAPAAIVAGSGPLGLRFADVGVRRAGVEINGLSGEIRPGSIVALGLQRRAESELLLQCAAGLELPDAGRIELLPGDGADRPGPLPVQSAFVPARPALFAGSILDNLSLFDRRLRSRARELSAQIGLAEIADRLPRGLRTEVGYETLPVLPAGAVKRIGIVRALIREPGLLALQSPGRWLDADGVARLQAMLQARRGTMTVLLATGDQKLIDLADTELRAADGRLEIAPRRSQA
jgi:ABC-type bacteriocin/lantibiotic exporter with double-glycine peptidase domain